MRGQLARLASQTAIYGLSSIVGRLLNFLLVPLYTRVFIQADYGIVTELYGYVGFLLVLLTYGMETGFFRYAKENESSDKVFTTAMVPLGISSAFFILIVFIFRIDIATALQYQDHTDYIVWFAFIIGIDAITAIPFAYLRQQEKAIRFATIRLINIGINIGLNLFFILLLPYLAVRYPESVFTKLYDPQMGIGYIFLANLIASLSTLLLLAPQFMLLFKKFYFNRVLFVSMLVYSIPLLFSGLAGMINETFDKIMLKHYIVVPETVIDANNYVMSQIGIYGANFKLAVFMMLFIQTFRYAAEPFFFSQSLEKNSKEIYSKVMLYFVLFMLLIFLTIMLYMDIVKNFISSDYHDGLMVVPIIMISKMFYGIFYNLSVWFKLTNKTLYGAYISLFGAFITILLNVLLIPVFGYVGSAWASFFSYFTMMLISYFVGQRYYKIEYPVKRILIYSSIVALIYFISNYVNISSFVLLISFRTLLLFSFVVFIVYYENLYKLIKTFVSKLWK